MEGETAERCSDPDHGVCIRATTLLRRTPDADSPTEFLEPGVWHARLNDDGATFTLTGLEEWDPPNVLVTPSRRPSEPYLELVLADFLGDDIVEIIRAQRLLADNGGG